MKTIQNIIELAELNRVYDPFYAGKTGAELFEWLITEIEEGKEELQREDYKELESEMGDILWNIFSLLNKLEDEGKINAERVFSKSVEKISSRKSFLLEKRKVTEQEARQIWNDAKRKEGYEESRLWI